ncbi:sensor histidine kinase [Paenibacillus sp. PAMC21692]|uniref:cache domain-containing sensor histidine kinase n=1 Tax=Paenibacillus sp. PAMC21692 TaxID=2762320 RepID=UPI0028FCA522|nr:sensor histidine kinase [Paenibacillus sp. PAMC21692]
MKTNREPGRRYLPIGYKLMLSYLVFIIILVSLNGYVSQSMYEKSMRKQTRSNIQATLIQIRDNVAYKTSDMIRISGTLYDDYTFVQHLKTDATGAENHYRMEQIILPKLDIATKSIGLHLRLSVYLRNESINERYEKRDALEDFNTQTFDLYHLRRIENKSWYKDIPPEQYGQTIQWKQIEEDEHDGRISMIRRIVDMSDLLQMREVGVMRFSVRKSELFESVVDSKLGPGSEITVKDEQGRLIYASAGSPSAYGAAAPSGPGKYAVTNPGRSQPYLTIAEEMPKQRWTIEAHVPLTVIEQEAVRVRAFIFAVCVVCFVLFTFAGVFISRYFSKRIMKFVSVLNAFREGDLHKRIAYRGRDEFSQIATALNGMGEDVEALINKVYLTQLQKKEAELEMLQTQINPHFLYNTLSSINRLAKFGENEKLEKMVVQLAKFYRLTLNSGKSLIRVSSEIEQTEAYLDIQKVKYGSRLEVAFDVDVRIWPYETIKLVLQPFVENALKHAWSGDRIYIRISVALEQNDLVYRIIDDGMGVRADRLAVIASMEAEGETGIGIRNIHQRVQLQYGERYGVTFYSRLGIGTTVMIRIPARRPGRSPSEEEPTG